MTTNITIKTYEQAPGDGVSFGGIKWEQKWDVCIQCDSREEAEAIKQRIAEAEQAQPVAWVDLLKEAEEIVRGKFLWKRFIDGTPLANDIAVWMADFVLQHTTPPQRKPLTEEEIDELQLPPSGTATVRDLVRIIEAAYGIKENT